MEHRDCKCTCENDGWIDWFMRRAEKRPGLLQARGPVQKAPAGPPRPVPALRTAEDRAASRRGFLKKLAVAAGGLLVWQGGIRPPAARACGGYEGDPMWDWTWYQWTGSFLSRAEWGARPPRQAVVVLSRAPTYVVVHHTASGNTSNFSQGQAIALSRSIQNWHMDGNGWIDSGQHFTMSRGGYLCEGRARSTEIELLACYASHVRGSHVANYNDVCLGIENEGTYTTTRPNDELMWGIITSVATSCFYNSVPSWNVKGHRDFNATACPGNYLYSLMPFIRAWVAFFLEGGEDPGWY